MLAAVRLDSKTTISEVQIIRPIILTYPVSTNIYTRRFAGVPLGTSGNIRILKGALKKRDLIEETGHRAEIQDPVFKQNPAGTSRNRRGFGVKKVG